MFDQIDRRFTQIGLDLGCPLVPDLLNVVLEGIEGGRSRQWTMSRGEWVSAQIFAYFIGGKFYDAVDLIKTKNNGEISPVSYEIIRSALTSNVKNVIPGYYAEDEDGNVVTFERGGSDVSLSIVGRGIDARLIEIWKKLNGMRATDPILVEDAKFISNITYDEAREIGIGGAEVVNKDTVGPIYRQGIPLDVKSSFAGKGINPLDPNYHGTMVTKTRVVDPTERVLGIAGKKGYLAVDIRKFGINDEYGVGARILEIFRKHKISYEYDPTQKDSLSIMLSGKYNGTLDETLNEIQSEIDPDRLDVTGNLGAVCVVGEGIKDNSMEVEARATAALARAGIKKAALNYPFGGISMTFGIEEYQVDNAIRTLCNEFSLRDLSIKKK